jgi:hypothetical protein
VVVAILIALLAVIAALTLHAFIRETYFTDCGNNILGLLCGRERRPEWVDPLGLGIVIVGIALAVATIRFANHFAKPS